MTERQAELIIGLLAAPIVLMVLFGCAILRNEERARAETEATIATV